ncbi:MAG: oxygen-independent coproporphyrinogen III oxidase [Gammaproteobacteria bacterium]
MRFSVIFRIVKIHDRTMSLSSTGHKIVFDLDLINRYDKTGPRYTSYPTAVQFTEDYGASDYRKWAEESNNDPLPAPLSLYLHIPFCNTICYYCACNKIVTRDYSKAKAYVQLLKQEIKLQAELFDRDRPVLQMHWGGGTPSYLHDDDIKVLLDCIHQNFNLASDDAGEFAIEVDPRTVDGARVHALRELGFNRISFGVQDFNPDVQDAINRVNSKEQILSVIDAARDAGFHSINIDLMYGLPKQTLASFAETIKTSIEVSPDRIAVYNYAHLPEMFKPQRRIDEQELPSAQDKLDMLQQTINQLQAADYVYIGMDHFAKKDDDMVRAQDNGSLYRNFQGYSTNADCDVIAMGITAIGRIGDNYSQNTRDLEQYEAILGRNEIPVFRGLELEPDDLLRKEVINQLMCYFKLDINKLETKWGVDFTRYFEPEFVHLREMEKDGLIRITEDHIEVLPAGRLLARSVCMEFDHYLQEKQMQQRFSKVI